MEDWLPGYRTEQRNNGGLVTWLPNRAMQQWRTGYLATEQSNTTMQDWLTGYRIERRNNGGLVTWLPNRGPDMGRCKGAPEPGVLRRSVRQPGNQSST
jgi:hypothetical protein